MLNSALDTILLIELMQTSIRMGVLVYMLLMVRFGQEILIT